MLKQVQHDVLQRICLICTIFFLTIPLFSEQIIDNDFCFSLDIPEGYALEDCSDDGMAYHFLHPNIPVNFVMKIVSEANVNKKNFNSQHALAQSLKKLNAQCDIDSFFWSNEICSIGTFSMQIDKQYSGWAVATPTSRENCFLVLLCYAPYDKEKKYDQFIMSTLNSLCISENFYNTPGIITSYAFPKEGDKKITLNVDGKKISTTIDKSDEEAAKFVVELEYSVLTLYANHKSKIDAWKRYYRMIYRDSFNRMQHVSADLHSTFYEKCKVKNPEITDITYAQILLSWVQNFSYERAKSAKETDFTCLPSVICNKDSDCDSRSLLLCVLLKSIGIETLFLFSPEYSHAIAATQIDAPGQTYSLEGYNKKFIFGETTAKVTWGMIAKAHADRSKWIPVILP